MSDVKILDVTFEKPKYRNTCEHPEESLVQMHEIVCDVDLVTVCTRCGVSFPGQTIEDLRVA